MSSSEAGNPDSMRRALLKAWGLGAASTPVMAAADFSGEPEQYFPDFPVDTHDGRRFRFYSDLIRGKIVMFNMMYTACTRACPPSTASLLAVQEALGSRIGQDIFIYSITLQPELDSSQALNDYAKRYGIKPGWSLLRTKPKDLLTLRRKLGFFNTDPIADRDIRKHTGMIRAGNESTDRWCMVPALSPTAQIVKAVINL